jgi:hypothetical protein
MTDDSIPAIEIIKDTIEKIDRHVKIEQVQYISDTMEYTVLLSKGNKNCKVSLSRNLLDDLNDYTGSRQSKYWMGLENNLKKRLSVAMQISSLIPFSSDVFFEDVQEWEQDDGHSIDVYFSESDYEIFQDGLKDVHQYLETQKTQLSLLNLKTFPYAEDQERIQNMISYRNEQISKNGSCPFRDKISITSRKHLKAAALIELLFLEQEITKAKYSETVKKEIAVKISKILSLLSSPIFEKIEVAEYLRGINKDKQFPQPKVVMPESQQEKQYDVVISFAGEDRAYAKQLADLLQKDGFHFFYDAYEEDELWGKDLYEHLSYIYSQAGKYCVMFLSKHYAAKQWTRHERRAAQERAFKENKEYILPIRIDDTKIPGILDTVAYQDLREKNIEEIYGILKRKLLPSEKPVTASPELNLKETLNLSDHAIVLLRFLSDKSEHALSNDPLLSAQEVLDNINLSEEEISIAADELEEKGYVKLLKTLGMGKIGFSDIGTTEALFALTDSYFKYWNPEDDSIELAQMLIKMSGGGSSVSIPEVNKNLEWGTRRLNPALFLLIERKIVEPSKALDPIYITKHVILKPRIHRYVNPL